MYLNLNLSGLNLNPLAWFYLIKFKYGHRSLVGLKLNFLTHFKFFSDTQFEDFCLYNFFVDRNVPTIEITIDHDLNQHELIELFEKLKNKIGEPCTYELSDAEKLEIVQIKNEIAEKEKLEREAEEKMRIEIEKEEKEKEIEEWVKLKNI